MIIDPIKLKHLKNSYSDFTKLANIDMKNVNLVKYLGVTLDKDLSFKFHIIFYFYLYIYPPARRKATEALYIG